MATTTTQTGHTNPDAITGAPGSHPGATGIGAGSGAATGAAIGMVGGPVGAAIGAVVGGAVGGLMGHAAGEAHDPSDTAYWKDEYKNREYYDDSADFDRDVAPAYNYGSSLAAVPTQPTEFSSTNKSAADFSTVETAAKQNWESVRGESSLSYDKARSAINDAYTRKVGLRGKPVQAE